MNQISALKGENIDELLETIVLVAEVHIIWSFGYSFFLFVLIFFSFDVLMSSLIHLFFFDV